MKKGLLVIAFIFCLLTNTYLVKAEKIQDNITGKQVLTMLMDGNKRFIAGKLIHPNCDSKRRLEISKQGQKPLAVILGCSDSRVPPEIIFDTGLGDLFVNRIAGEVVDLDGIGSLEYGIEHFDIPLLIVLGHTKCGAVTAVVEKIKSDGDIPHLLNSIKPAVQKTISKNPNLKGDDLILEAVKMNVLQSIEEIYSNSETIRKLVKKGELRIVGALYNLDTGEVTIIEQDYKGIKND